MKRHSIDHLNFEAEGATETQRAVDRVKANISPKIPCVNADADGYCTRNGGGFICFKCTDYKPVTAVTVADGSATMPALVLEHPVCATPAESVRFDLAMAKKHGAMTLAYLARAGWRLACEKQGMGHGAWQDWCKSINLSHDTAERYIKFYYSTVGEHLRAQGTAHRLVDNLTDAMIEEATAGLESKTATGAMIELGIVKRPAGWGGAREGAGRTPGALPKLTEKQEAETLWARAMIEFDKPSLKDAIRFLGEKAAEACLARVAELADALKLQVRELRGVR